MKKIMARGSILLILIAGVVLISEGIHFLILNYVRPMWPSWREAWFHIGIYIIISIWCWRSYKIHEEMNTRGKTQTE